MKRLTDELRFTMEKIPKIDFALLYSSMVGVLGLDKAIEVLNHYVELEECLKERKHTQEDHFDKDV